MSVEVRPVDFDLALAVLTVDRDLFSSRCLPGAASLIHDAILHVVELRDAGRRDAALLLDLCWPSSLSSSVATIEND